jgi:hypothetical protein
MPSVAGYAKAVLFLSGEHLAAPAVAYACPTMTE